MKDNKPAFDVKATPLDFAIGRVSPVKQAFVDKYIINSRSSASRGELAVFFAIARTTEWSTALLLVDPTGDPLLYQGNKGQAILTTYGNRSAKRTLRQLADATGQSYGATQKSVRKWIEAGVLTELPTTLFERKTKALASGRPEIKLRFEIDADYCWNGPLWLGTGYKYGRIDQAADITGRPI